MRRLENVVEQVERRVPRGLTAGDVRTCRRKTLRVDDARPGVGRTTTLDRRRSGVATPRRVVCAHDAVFMTAVAERENK